MLNLVCILTSSTVTRHLSLLSRSKRGGINQLPAFIHQDISDLTTPLPTEIISDCILNKTFSDFLKLALVTPIYKGKGSKCDPSNYRPIFSLPILSKVFENFLREQLSFHLSKHSIFWQTVWLPETSFNLADVAGSPAWMVPTLR